MRAALAVAAVTVVAGALADVADAASPAFIREHGGCRSWRCVLRVRAKRERRIVVAARTVEATSYCLHGRMADGTYTRDGSAASNDYPLGTVLRLRRAVRGLSTWVVRDRIGYGTQLDLWASSCGEAVAFGRQPVTFSVAR